MVPEGLFALSTFAQMPKETASYDREHLSLCISIEMRDHEVRSRYGKVNTSNHYVQQPCLESSGRESKIIESEIAMHICQLVPLAYPESCVTSSVCNHLTP